MKTTSLFNTDPINPGVGLNFYFNVMILYETKEGAWGAREIFQKLLDRFGDEFLFQIDFWRFDVLENEQVQEEVAWACSVADLIIVSTESGKVPAAVGDWLRRCARGRTETSALVGLFGNEHESNVIESAMREFMLPIARNLNFFVHETNPHQRLNSDDGDVWLSPNRKPPIDRSLHQV